MKDILQDIIANKRVEIEHAKRFVSTTQLRQHAQSCIRVRRSMKKALASSPTGIIAEFKRKSPSKGWISPDAVPMTVTQVYEAAGAAALSILTDLQFFGGTIADIANSRQRIDLPILRKDFIIDEYQLLQAYLAGADAVLLIAVCLSPEQCAQLVEQAHQIGLEVLLEIHSPEEMEYVTDAVDMVGVNNRNLGTFHTDINNSFAIAEELCKLAKDKVMVSESGLSSSDVIKELRAVGYRGFLIGESFMKTSSPGHALKVLIDDLQS